MYTAETEGEEGENFVVLAVIVITAKKKRLLTKNVANEEGRDRDVENNSS